MSKYAISQEPNEDFEGGARLLIIGVGGGGGNAVEHMVQQGVSGVSFVCVNTDRQVLDKLTVPNKFQLGVQETRGLGAGGNPEVGRMAAEADEEELKALLKDYDMIFIAAGMGGGTGTGAAPVIARIAKDMDKLAVAVVTTPFHFEGGRRAKAAKDGIEQLAAQVDSIVTIPNEKLQNVYRNLTMREAFKKADDVLLYGVKGLIQAIRSVGGINLDFNDVRTLMNATKGHAMMGIGRASGDDRAKQAAEKAIRSPLLDDLRLENAKGVLINITASDILMSEPGEIAEIVSSIADLDDANIFYGVVYDDTMGEDIEVTVIATGLTLDSKSKTPPPQKNIFDNPPVREPIAEPVQRAPAPKRNLNVEDFLKNRIPN